MASKNRSSSEIEATQARTVGKSMETIAEIQKADTTFASSLKASIAVPL